MTSLLKAGTVLCSESVPPRLCTGSTSYGGAVGGGVECVLKGSLLITCSAPYKGLQIKLE